MTVTDKKSIFAEVQNLKKELLSMRIKSSSGDAISVTNYRKKKKEIARLLTKINTKVS